MDVELMLAPPLVPAAVFGAIAVASSPWNARRIGARVLIAVPVFLAIDLLSAFVVGFTARAVADSRPNALLEGMLHGFAAWALYIIGVLLFSAPAIIIGSSVTAAVRFGLRARFPGARPGPVASDGRGDHQWALRMAAFAVVVAGVWLWQVYVAFQPRMR
jgi:hypothetical protein